MLDRTEAGDVSDLKRQLQALRLDEAEEPSRRWRWTAAIVVVLLLAAGVLAWRSRDAWAAIDVQTARPLVQSGDAGTVSNTPILTAAGYVVARRRAVVSAKIQGRLEELRVEEGDRIGEGELIAKLESSDFQAQIVRARARVASTRTQISRADAAVVRAEADLAEAKRQLDLREKLAAERVASTDERETARNRVAVLDASLAQARADRESAVAGLGEAEADVRLNEALYQNTLIRAPFTGTVVRKMAEVGESVAPIPPGVNISTASGAIVALADLDTLEAEVDVAESNVARLKPSQPAEVTVEAFPDKKYRAILRQVIPTADRTKATVLVKVTLLDKDENLKPEMSARVTFLEFPRTDVAQAAPASLILVPQQAVVTRDGRTLVFEVVDNKARLRPVRLGTSQRDQIVVTEGLSGAETLVVSPPADLQDGTTVRVPTGN
ncbi:MAG: efflux RND transporter periplasmic adaptor subunit [Vicinamibacterales bacterium]